MADFPPDILTKTYGYAFKVGQDRPIFDFQKRIYEHVMQDLYKKEQSMTFILWSPSGKTNPEATFVDYDVAHKVAKAMAVRYDQEFFVCKLVSKTVPAPKTITTKL